jgi:hypothetical protein
VTFLLAVLGASLLGSVHCAAMCGGFVCMYAGTGTHRASSPALPHITYNLGRLVSYLVLGVVAGSVGSAVDQLGGLARIGRLAAIVAGALMVAWSASTVLAASGIRVPRWGVPAGVQTVLGGVLLRLRGRSPEVRGAATGLLTTLLPCGWLYAFVATAGGTGRVRDAVLVMLFFWIGTLPMMAAVGAGAQRLFGTFQRRLPLVGAVAALVLGLLSIAGKMSVRPQGQPMDHPTHVARVTEAARDGR